jgi:Lanthionine synthetase C-like protein
MLHSPDAHEPLTDARWDPERVRGAIRAIVEDAEAAFADGWPVHPADREPGDPDDARLRSLYIGGAGVVRALTALQQRGLAELDRDYEPYLERPFVPDFPEFAHPPSLLMGELGIRMARHRVSPSPENADRIAELVAANTRDAHRELMWGSPGSLLAARAMHEMTGEERWLGLWREGAAWLRAQWEPETDLWTQELYGRSRAFFGPAHGFAGCVLSLLAEPEGELHRRAAAAVRRYAVEEDGLVNWPAVIDPSMGLDSGSGEIRVQWCHGAPGIVATLARLALDDAEHGQLLVGGGELTWRAGPLRKGANLCHGTAGNGCAFLALFARTGDELWLRRARAFAMHALAQVARDRQTHGHGRYSLWTGDPGTALYLADCLDGDGDLPLP